MNRSDLIKVRIFGQSCVWGCHYGAGGPNAAPLFQSGLCLLSLCLSVSTVLCSSANEFICTSPCLSQHINPDHWSHPHGKTVPLRAWRGASDWPFNLGPPLDPWRWVSAHLHFNTVPAHTQAPAPHSLTLASHDTLSTAHGGHKNCPPGCPDWMHHIIHYIQEWSCGHAWMISVFKNEGIKLRAIDLFTSQTDTVLFPKPPRWDVLPQLIWVQRCDNRWFMSKLH